MSNLSIKLKVLAVDDNRTNLHILQVFLKKLGHEVVLADNGEEAVRKFEAEAPDLILLDIMMPIMDGFEAARRIKGMNVDRWVPIIFLSALNRDENLVEGLDAGADDYLTKPVNFVVLEAKLRSMSRSLALQKQSIESLRRVQAISDSVFDAIVTINRQGEIVAVNRSASGLFGWSAAELVGKDIATLLPPEDTVLAPLFKSPEAPATLDSEGERELEVLHRDGRLFPATLSLGQVELDNQQMIVAVVRDISERKQAQQELLENARQLQVYYDQTQAEQQLSLRLMAKQLHRQGLRDPALCYKVIPAERFSGDVVAAARSDDGKLYALLADATGHGLAAAICVLPLLTLFYRMTKTPQPLREIVLELNQQLKESMPIGRFVALTIVRLDMNARQGEIWVGGTPEALLFDREGRLATRFSSNNLPLGIIGNEQLDTEVTPFTWEPESQLFLFSDGLVEANDPDNLQFGIAGIERAALQTSGAERFAKIEEALGVHQKGVPAADDVSMVLIDCN